MDSMADEPVTGTDAGAEPTFEQEFEAAREEQTGAEPSQAAEAGEEPAKATDGGDPAEPEARAPLPPEEIEKRWKDSKAALKAERAERQRSAEKAAALEAELATLRAGRGADQQQTAADEPPDHEDDPIGAIEWMKARIAANDAKEAEAQAAQEARQRESQEVQSLTKEFSDHEAEFREETPDYDDAVKYLRENRVKELILFGYPENEAINLFAQEVFATLRDTKQRGLNPAQVAYGLAKQRGYAGKVAGATMLDTIAKGQSAAKTLSGGGGKGNGELTVEAVGNLKGAAFDTAFAKLMSQERERERRLG